MTPDDVDLERLFLYHQPGPAAQWRHAAINSEMLATARKLCGLMPPCRERSVMLTKLQEARMWANAAVACNQEMLIPREPAA